MELNKKDRKWLDHINVASDGSGMYPGEHCEFIPRKVGQKLLNAGLIEMFTPHNPVHKERYVITQAGREALGL